MQVLGDIQKSLGRGDLGITDPAAARQLVRLEPGMSLRGRIAGTAAGGRARGVSVSRPGGHGRAGAAGPTDSCHCRFRSHGGSDEPENLITLCAWHHQRGVHGGLVRITGRAPDRLRFELGLRDGEPPLMVFESGDRLVR